MQPDQSHQPDPDLIQRIAADYLQTLHEEAQKLIAAGWNPTRAVDEVIRASQLAYAMQRLNR